ncbi:MAG: hypothetical protein IKF00_10360 [Solobacterium sp.]|nr:hypothetical protein [Solobacterium sp.]
MKFLKSFFAVLLLFSLTGCKSKEVTSLEKQINEIQSADFKIEDGDEITAAKNAYAQLNEKDAQAVSNYAKLEELDQAFTDFYIKQADEATAKLEEANQKLNQLDLDGAYTLLQEVLPTAKALKNSTYSDLLTVDPEETVQNWIDLIDTVCFPDTRILTPDNYMKIAKVSNASSSSGDDFTVYNVSDKTGLRYYTYMYSNGTKLVNAFKAYSDYWKSIMTLDDIGKTDNGFLYHFTDAQGRSFKLENLVMNLGAYGNYTWMMVHLDDSIKLPEK